MDKAQEVFGRALVADHQAPKVAHVSKEPFNFPTPLVTPELSAILGTGLSTVVPVRRNQLNTFDGKRRTGTVSKVALEMLSFNGCCHRLEFLEHPEHAKQ